jgi:hypothetical protein
VHVMSVARRVMRWTCIAMASSVLAGCMPLTRAPARVPPLDVPAGSIELYAVGDMADCRRDPPGQSAARLVSALVPPGATLLALGDIVYPYADAEALAGCYEPTWGSHRATTLAVAGNHDYVENESHTFREYFQLDGRAVSERYVAYTERLSPDWLLVVVDSNARGGALTHQLEWLRATLESVRPVTGEGTSSQASPRCLAVAWHAPLYSSGWHRGSGDHMRPYWELVDAYGADFVLSGHEHFYEAFAPFDARGQRAASGPRQFTVGTGGARLYGFWKPPYESRARVLEFGVLRLVLAPGRYDWRFIDVDRQVRDAGTADCRGARRAGGVPSSLDLG